MAHSAHLTTSLLILVTSVTNTKCAYVKNTSFCRDLVASFNGTAIQGISPNIELWEAMFAIIGFGLFAMLLAFAFTIIRSVIYRDTENLDTAFDAGGRVSFGLTATTIVSQWTWAATLLQSSTVASKFGISGPFWYAAGATIQILLFAMLSIQLKIRAPGAKTFLQVIKARFGLRTHIVFCVFALLTNIIVTSMLMLGGAAVLTNLVRNLSREYATILVAIVIYAYTSIGGLGATFYVSYFNSATMYIIMLLFIQAVYNDEESGHALGSPERVYNLITCRVGPETNAEGSYLTILSNSGLMFGIINIVDKDLEDHVCRPVHWKEAYVMVNLGNFGTVFVDQSYWQSSVASKPGQGVWGFLTGGVAWFAIPFCLATTTGLAYIALSTIQGQPLLTMDDTNAGLVPPAVAQALLGKSGSMMMTFMILMAVTSTGSAEVVAVTSILIYDIYQIHLKPYRKVLDDNACLLCGKQRGRMANPRDKCACVAMANCSECHSDDQQRSQSKRSALRPDFKCKTHGQYRRYAEYLGRLKNWCIVWVTAAIFPLTMILDLMQLNLSWVYTFMGILIGSAVIPITLAVSWSRCSSKGMMSGSIGGMILAFVVWLSLAGVKDGGLHDFFTNTSDDVAMVCGNLVAILGGGLICVVVSLVVNRGMDAARVAEIWENTRDIDNPLSPWPAMYARELKLTGVQHLDNRPSLADVEKVFRGAKHIAYGGAIALTLILIIIWPSAMTAIEVMTFDQFYDWVKFSDVLAWATTIFLVVVPLGCEIWEIRKILTTKTELILQSGRRDSHPIVQSMGKVFKKSSVAPTNNEIREIKEEPPHETIENGSGDFVNLRELRNASIDTAGNVDT